MINPIVVIVLSVVLSPEAPKSMLIAWCGATIAVTLVRYRLLSQYLRYVRTGHEAEWGRRYAAGAIGQGLVWGIGSVVLLFNTSGAHQGLILVAVTGICAGAVPLLAPIQLAYEGFLYSTAVPVIVWLLIQFDSDYALLAAVGLLYVIMCVRAAALFRSLVVETTRLDSEKSALIGELADAQSSLRRDLQARQDIEAALQQRAAFERIITNLSSDFVRVATDQIGAGIKLGLGTIGHFARVERSYLALFRGDRGLIELVYEWCAADVPPRRERRLDARRLPFLTDKMRRGEFLYVDNVDKACADGEQALLRDEHVRSVIVVPMLLGSQVRGFLGFDSSESQRQWDEDVIALLHIAAGTFINALERKRVEERLWFEANHDPLTALPNRRLFFDRLPRMVERCRETSRMGAVMFFDLDDFKAINDTHGHTVGDMLLRHVAKRTHATLARGDLTARMGGDEFVLVLSNLGAEVQTASHNVRSFAMRVRKTISEPFTLAGRQHAVSASIGVALFPSEQCVAEDIVMRADKAMYRAKSTPEGIFIWPPAAALALGN